MREILFRGKRLDNDEWVEGYLGQDTLIGNNKTWLGYVIRSVPQKPWDCDWFEVDPETAGQFTGLLDENGKRIFEGDILEHHVQGDILVNRGVVNWDARNGRWAHQLNTMNPCFYMHNPDAFEVIGNIHDNPELLEGEN